MNNLVRSGVVLPGSSRALSVGRILAAFLVSSIAATIIACGGSGTATTTGPSTVPDTSTLAGTWKGTVDGSYGFSVITTKLNADSTFSAEGELALYCKVTGKWTVAAGTFTSTGRDCDNVTVTWVAPVHNLRLTGTWTASSARSGTFTVAKQ
jgi:hypothetical protein